MNYLRGALSAASQYYKDLPPINPSTLTGAIDVVVVQKPSDNGDTELACSPFHVRFGKWQVLRPGEKKVTVLVNGQPIPFDMKIGDAGEAFFVFETDEDVPDELITSPLLHATNVVQSNDDITKESQGGDEHLAAKATRPTTGEETSEPDFFDLDAPDLDSRPGTVPANTFRRVETASADSRISHDVDTSLTEDRAINPIVTIHEGDGDDILSSVDERDAQPPQVTYHHDVVLDASGYHSKEVSERTIGSSDITKASRTQSDTAVDIVLTPDAFRTPSPESVGETSSGRVIRATSEPPEYGASSPPPEYSWEWGAFPKRPPLKNTFLAENSDLLRRQKSAPQMADSTGEKAAPGSRPRSPVPEAALADGGSLEGDLEDPYRICLVFEEQKLGFEVSLCGNVTFGEDAVEDSRLFDGSRITFTRLIEDPNVAHSKDLVVRWDDEYIRPQDNSPLISALATWRRRTLSRPSPPQYASERHSGRSTSIAAPRPSKSGWSRWWSRNRAEPNAGTHLDEQQATEIPQDMPHAKRPPLEHASSAPSDAVSSISLSAAKPSSIPFPSTSVAESSQKKYARTLRLTSDQLKALNLQKGANTITFSLSATGHVACTARIFVWDATDHIVVSDIDGTITKSDALGHVFTMIGRDWTHLGVAKLYTDICRNGYKIMYLTSRAIGQADSTRDYLKGINQNNYQLPEGPVIMSPDRLLTSLHREVIMRKPELFKMACLRDIQRLFGAISSHNPFYAGFGNRITDALSYRSVNIPSERIFTIDSSGEVKMELLALAGYKSSYIHMTDIVDQMFPPINRKVAPEYTDFKYWRAPVQEFELPEAFIAPPSPTLSASARSDTSNQSALSRLRQFRLGRSTSRSPAAESSSSMPVNPNKKVFEGAAHVRAATSLDRLGSKASEGKIWGGGRFGISSMRFDSGELQYEDDDARGRRRKNRLSADNMPGSLSGSMEDRIWRRWGSRRDDEEGEEDGEGGEDGVQEGEEDEIEDDTAAEEAFGDDAAAEEAFDVDLIATGEMESVPFL